MIDKTIYTISTKYATYRPTDISNLEKVIRTAVEISQVENMPVHLYLNGELVVVDAGPTTTKLVKDYLYNIDYKRSLGQYLEKMRGGH